MYLSLLLYFTMLPPFVHQYAGPGVQQSSSQFVPILCNPASTFIRSIPFFTTILPIELNLKSRSRPQSPKVSKFFESMFQLSQCRLVFRCMITQKMIKVEGTMTNWLIMCTYRRSCATWATTSMLSRSWLRRPPSLSRSTHSRTAGSSRFIFYDF